MKRHEAIAAILSILNEDNIAIFTTGMISREALSIKDRNGNLYMIGSMGLASSVGLGIALNSNKKVVIIDGDGSALMDLGTMAVIGSEKAENLIHVVLDNGVYQSTGGQPTISSKIDLSKIAKIAGYSCTTVIENLEDKNILDKLMGSKGPVCIVMKVDKDSLKPPRIDLLPEQITERIRRSILTNQKDLNGGNGE